MKRRYLSAADTLRVPSDVDGELACDLAELWETLMERAVHRFDRPHPDDPRAVLTFDEFKQVLRHAYECDDVRVEAEIDRFVNEGGARPG
jgi:hypothetical protein